MQVIDSHTAGEPTRVIIEGGPMLGDGSISDKAKALEANHKDFCSSVLLEPRGHDALVGALLVPASNPKCVTGVIYFNPVGNLGMCGHATIGLAITLLHMGLVEIGRHLIETPVGIVEVDIKDQHTVSVSNVESYRYAKDVSVEVDTMGTIKGDIAWGGNWFFLTQDCSIPLEFKNIPTLTNAAMKIRDALTSAGITGRDGALIDHVEFFGPALSGQAHARNFVLCPGSVYDRSPCGTGCSAKMACLAADNKWQTGEVWVQESIIGSTYELAFEHGKKVGIIPRITGKAFITSEANLIFSDSDPYASGIKA